MFESEQICPYTGLRSFTEEESLYFKGREEDIDYATEQLQRNKFLMLTGASGDGKSSLIYAGIIPNARAGFLKAKYTQWCVADFRPERTPFDNLCQSLARQLDIGNVHSVEAELNHGFSAITDLYKNSKRYVDTQSIAWQRADEKEQAALKREAANLIILVDQFEEFFTNPENYHKGAPSSEANLVLNLLLETARIALEEDLPIYIVFTMRSDYIGQCAAFRGLPEYIGFSQFFVPRLNRTQLQQVIEEPAVLSGNRITRRLTERLIHDLTEGVDQLPILQHALNQVWHAADNGREEMDLIHYAMVGGMPAHELPDEQTGRFNQWFEGLPEVIKACYHKPDLQNVLDTHTNKLYEQASDYYKAKTGKSITSEDAKSIIRSAFVCLTKIDQSRAVRNRMTLEEIVNIFGNPQFGTKEVGAVMNIFREPGNTFIRPFIMEGSESRDLMPADILDITHESLIRNWEYLGQWAKEEFDDYTISLDFEQQLNRWVDSDKSKGFLLPIGPLTYFENWFNRVKPNAHWIARYLPEEIEEENKLTKARQVLGNAEEFLSRSAQKHVVTRTFIRFGAKRVAAALGILAVVIFGIYGVRDYLRRQNSSVLKSIKKETFKLANISKLSLGFTIPVITEQLMQGNLTIPEVINAVRDTAQKIKIATGITTHLVRQGRYQPRKEILQSLGIADTLLESLKMTPDSRSLSEQIKLIHDHAVTVGMAYFFSQDDTLRRYVLNNARRSARWSMYILQEQPAGFTDIQDLSLALDNAINYKIFTTGEINELLKILSPFENGNRSDWVENNYQRDKLLNRGNNDYGIRHNGLFQDLAYFYAAVGNADKALQCVDSVLQYSSGFLDNDYGAHVENASNIAAVFYTYETLDALDPFVTGYCQRKKITATDFYNRLVSRALIDPPVSSNTNFYPSAGGQSFSNLNLKFSSDAMLSYFFGKLKDEVRRIPDPDERRFMLGVILKNEGVHFSCRDNVRGIQESRPDTLFAEAISNYLQVSQSYLNTSIVTIGGSGADLITVPRRYIFLYPDYKVGFHSFEPRSLNLLYFAHNFIEYVLDKGLFDNLYENPNDSKVFEDWLSDYQISMTLQNSTLKNPVPATLLDKLASTLEQRKLNQYANFNLLYLHLADGAFTRGDAKKGVGYLEKVQLEKLLNSFQYKLTNYVNNYSFELTGKAIANLSVHDRYDLAYRFLDIFKKPVNRSSLYAFASQTISMGNQSPEWAGRLLDSAQVEQKRSIDLTGGKPDRLEIAIALMYQEPGKHSREAYQIIKNNGGKEVAITRFSRSYAFHGQLYKAVKQEPPGVSISDHSFYLWNCIYGINLSKGIPEEWQPFMEGSLFFSRLFLPYQSENE